jgi:hypothetical protein
MEPPTYGVLALRADRTAPLAQVLLRRPWMKVGDAPLLANVVQSVYGCVADHASVAIRAELNDAEVSARCNRFVQENEAVVQGNNDAAYAGTRANNWNILVTDKLVCDYGYGIETAFSMLTDQQPGSPRSATGARGAAAVRPVPSASPVGPFQIVNHLPNATALTNKANLIRALNRQYAGSGSHVFDVVPTSYYLPVGAGAVAVGADGAADHPTLSQFFKRFSAIAHGNMESLRMPSKQCEYLSGCCDKDGRSFCCSADSRLLALLFLLFLLFLLLQASAICG